MRTPTFIHIPRTGGNSILPHLLGKNANVIHHVEKSFPENLSENWLFTFMRDPCDRVVSAYAYLRNGGRSEQDERDADVYVRPFSNLEDFVFRGLEKASCNQRHFRPQTYWITDETGKTVPNFIGRTERLQKDFDRVCDACGWERIIISVENSSLRKGLTCTQSMREVILRVYAGDCLLLQKFESELADGLMGRIISRFNNNYPLETRDIIWDTCMAMARNTELTEDSLKNMCQTTLVTGFGGGGGAPQVIGLAEAIGVCGISNPENNAFHGKYCPSPANVEGMSIDDVLDKIESVFPVPIHFPSFTGNCLQGFHTERHGTLTDRYMLYLWILKRILEICPDRNSPIIEIGAGFGVLGYYLHGAGYRDYTTVDLSLINACQTYFLTQNLPDRKLILSGEVADPFDRRHADAIKLLHSTDFHDVPRNRFAIMVNMDGLTEYGLAEASKYVQSDCAPILFSINHEVNPYRVCEIPQPHRNRAYRYPFWLRPGYVEELYVAK